MFDIKHFKNYSMHILIIPSWYMANSQSVSGVFFREQAHALKRAGFQVGVIAPIHYSLKEFKSKAISKPKDILFEDDDGIPTYRLYRTNWLPKVPYGRSWLWSGAGRNLFHQYLDSYGKPDVIHAHTALFAGLLGGRLKRDYRIPLVLTEHSSAYATSMAPPWQINLAKRAFCSADARIFVSPELGRLLEDRLGDVVQPWLWIPNIVSPEFCLPEVSEDAEKVFRFLSIGALNDNKNQRDLIYSFANSFKGQPDVQLRLGGDGPLRDELENLAKRLGVSQQVVFLGMLDRKQTVAEMQTADVFVLPSIYETFGLVLVEALACGKPVVATACGGPESIVNVENGILVPTNDTTALASALVKIRGTISAYNSEDIHSDSLSRFGEQAVVERLSEVYTTVVT